MWAAVEASSPLRRSIRGHGDSRRRTDRETTYFDMRILLLSHILRRVTPSVPPPFADLPQETRRLSL
jgi:hypothetical protein